MKCVTKLVGKSVKNKRLEDAAATEGTNKMDLKENRLGCGLVSSGSGQNQWRALVNTVTNFRFPLRCDELPRTYELLKWLAAPRILYWYGQLTRYEQHYLWDTAEMSRNRNFY